MGLNGLVARRTEGYLCVKVSASVLVSVSVGDYLCASVGVCESVWEWVCRGMQVCADVFM